MLPWAGNLKCLMIKTLLKGENFYICNIICYVCI